jgi:hypothetical protein
MEKWPYKFDGGQNLTEKDVRDAIEKLQRVLQTEITFKKV